MKAGSVLEAWAKMGWCTGVQEKLWSKNWGVVRSFLVKFMGRKIENFQIFSKVFQEVLQAYQTLFQVVRGYKKLFQSLKRMKNGQKLILERSIFDHQRAPNRNFNPPKFIVRFNLVGSNRLNMPKVHILELGFGTATPIYTI